MPSRNMTSKHSVTDNHKLAEAGLEPTLRGHEPRWLPLPHPAPLGKGIRTPV